MIPNPIRRVLSSIDAHGVRALLMGGQACVFYGAAEFSRDADFAVLASPRNLDRLSAALDDLQAQVIAVPPFEPKYLRRGHAVHFRCRDPEVEGLRVDVMTKLSWSACAMPAHSGGRPEAAGRRAGKLSSKAPEREALTTLICIHRMQLQRSRRMKHLTVRNLPPEIGRALEREKRRRGTSLNQTVIDVLGQGLGVGAPEGRRNGLKRLAGTWTEADVKAFEDAIAALERVDDELWR